MTMSAAISDDSSVKSLSGITVIILQEWEVKEINGLKLTAGDRAFVKQLSVGRNLKVQFDELRMGLRVRVYAWVGVIRLETIELRISPKVTGGNLGLVQMLEFVSGLDGLRKLIGNTKIETEGNSLFDLIAFLFADAVKDVIRKGILSGYIEREEALSCVRGRILPDQQLMKRFGALDRIYCRYDEFDQDVVENRLLVVFLNLILGRVRNQDVRRKLSRMRAILEGICNPGKFDIRKVRQEIIYNRQNMHYERAHSLGWMLLDGLGVDDILALGKTGCFAFLLNMNVLFEGFIRKLIERVLPSDEYRMNYQNSQRSILFNVNSNSYYKEIIPDVTISRRGQNGLLVIDSKYKLYDEKKLAMGDIYQAFLYAYALGVRKPGVYPRSILLYPSTLMNREGIHLKIRTMGGKTGSEIFGIGVPIPAVLDELKDSNQGPYCRGLQDKIISSFAPV